MSTSWSTATVSWRDYYAKSGTLTFQPGQTSKSITISVRGDRTQEADETFFVNLSGATNAQIADGQGKGTILNDDGVSRKLSSYFAAVDAAIEQLMFFSPRKRA